jgi:hypothetical protein
LVQFFFCEDILFRAYKYLVFCYALRSHFVLAPAKRSWVPNSVEFLQRRVNFFVLDFQGVWCCV